MSSDFVQVGTSFHMILLGDGQAADWPELTMDREVLEPHPPLGLWLFTGMHTGLVGIRLTFHPLEPALDSHLWPHHDVAHLYLSSTSFQAVSTMGYGDLAEITLPHPGEYFVRAAWSRRPREDHNDFADDGEEQYLIDVWPA